MWYKPYEIAYLYKEIKKLEQKEVKVEKPSRFDRILNASFILLGFIGICILIHLITGLINSTVCSVHNPLIPIL